ncbi:hypothetical protein EMIHUDRAFT_453412 [Emiliania huxleyi CCMP1516]|uniref:ACB domain-containing protein n=2 Tax=Emiliania huxleyi TaxID=2903 RepID=A0A0D3I6D0_EMIH1|nr:hypothetical protein EMIHUDRAFT_453412 [Emiliania huxleyi CCMP1516]EOD06815.1 hypothetical protein EMIHUDRAFT_453412 [Emiliania huxleyi CCMP1516]|eukprot:XP_005759244.1 hypothetical protein EMIHUDRAFT_453412 [Emiliania huxleyi CCMP1516]
MGIAGHASPSPRQQRLVRRAGARLPRKYEAARAFVGDASDGHGGGIAWSEADVSDSDRLLLYALQRQAEDGQCTAGSPSYWGSERAKWKAWRELGSMSQIEAMVHYARAVEELAPRWSAVSGCATPAAPSRAAPSLAPSPAPSPALEQSDVAELAWRIRAIMAQHAEDCKRMTPHYAARYAKRSLDALQAAGPPTPDRPRTPSAASCPAESIASPAPSVARPTPGRGGGRTPAAAALAGGGGAAPYAPPHRSPFGVAPSRAGSSQRPPTSLAEGGGTPMRVV